MFNLSQYFPITDPTLIFFVVLLIILFAPIIMGKLRIPHNHRNGACRRTAWAVRTGHFSA